ncbi:hypothetical protein BDA96_03G169000 [Sorghum bicolor]|uniref:Uncharacterized protein n=2 Tax=Sorghum bicolor TaxID=4558 RepID=A0A921RC41_SORBI|nr:hypothetical protein BDA96_03G169000 [Sorghum bicolor]OQU86837.1 hypothetical protein SORBI_3003G160433 [Sorghum bicolor]
MKGGALFAVLLDTTSRSGAMCDVNVTWRWISIYERMGSLLRVLDHFSCPLAYVTCAFVASTGQVAVIITGNNICMIAGFSIL